MTQSKQKEWLTDILESIPSIAFILIWRSSGDLELAGWAGSLLAMIVFIILKGLRTPSHPVLLGVNIHLLLATPIIVGLYRIGVDGPAEFLADHGYNGVLVTVFAVGCVLTIGAKGGFIGAPELPKRLRYAYSGWLIGLCLCAVIWTFWVEANGLVAVVLPLTALFMVRRLLLARWHDQNGINSGVVVFAAPALGNGSSDMF